MNSYETHIRWLAERRKLSTCDDRALMAVGRAGTGWSFAFDSGSTHLAPQRFVSPAAAATADADYRAVVVWGSLRATHGDPFFHLSVARGGEELYAFPYADGEVRRSGQNPPRTGRTGTSPSRTGRTGSSPPRRARTGSPSPAPRRSPKDGGGRRGGTALLTAVAAEFEVHLPRHAITRGRLHTFIIRSWARPPQEGATP